MKKLSPMIFVFLILYIGISKAVIIEKIVAVVNGKPITLTELQEKQMILKAVTGEDLPMKEVLNRMIMEELEMQEAKKLNLIAEDEVVNEYIATMLKENSISLEDFKNLLKEKGISFEHYKEEIRRRITITRLINTQIRMRTAVAEEEVRNYYESHKNELKGSYEELKEKIRNLLLSQRIEERYKKWLDELMKKSSIKIMF